MSVISIVNHKGGVGKTTTAINLASGLIKYKLCKRCLLIDLDPQANLSQSLGLLDQENTIYEALHGKIPLTPIEIKKGLDVVPSKLDLSGIEIELASETGRELILKDLIKPISKKYVTFVYMFTINNIGVIHKNTIYNRNHSYINFYSLSNRLKVIKDEVTNNEKGRINLAKQDKISD